MQRAHSRRVAAALALAVVAAPAPGRSQVAGARATAIAVDLVVAATTDVHGRIRGWDYYTDSADADRGLARVAPILDSIRAAAPGRTIVLDAGDFLQGNPFTYVARNAPTPHPVIAAMNAMRYDAVAIGNHEFNYGLPALDRALAGATFPIVAANVRRIDGKRGWAPAAFVTREGVRVAIVGVTTPWAMVWDKLHLQGKLAIDDIVTALRRSVADARAAGAQVVVVLAHAGLDPVNGPAEQLAGVPAEHPMSTVAREVPGIDLIVFGHSHREVADTTINGVLLVQPRNWATSVAVATLHVERDGRGWKVGAKHGVTIQAAGHAEDPALVRLVAATHDAARRYAAGVVGTTAAEWRTDSARTRAAPLIDFIGEVMRRATGADLASSAAFSTRVTLHPGPITVASVARLYPYDNTLRVVKLSGALLKDYLEHSASYFVVGGTPDQPTIRTAFPGYNFEGVVGATYALDLSRPVGDRVRDLAVSGRPVAPSDSFTLALTNYRASGTGGYGLLAAARVVKDDSREVRQLLIDEITRRKVIAPADFAQGGWRVVPAAHAAAVQRAMDAEPEFETARRQAAGARPATLRVIAINDFHGGLEARPDGNAGTRGGAAQFAAVIRRLRAECTGSCVSVLVDGGDEFQGTPASNLAFGTPVVKIFNALDVAAAALGNHDFDWGQDTLRARMREMRYGMFGANVTDAAGRPVPWIRSDTIVERGGLRIGIVGLAMTGTPAVTKPANLTGLRFTRAAPVAVERARALRARGADVVIAAIHAGEDCRGATCSGEPIEIATLGAGLIDAVVGGHNHLEHEMRVGDVPVLRSRSSGRSVSYVDLPVARNARTGVEAHNVFVATESIAPDPEIAAVTDAALAPVRAIANQTIILVPELLRRTGSPQYPLGNLVADAQRAACQSDVAVMNNGGIRAELRAGPATYTSFFEIQPFGNELVRLTVPGSALRAYAEHVVATGMRVHFSGATMRVDTTRRAGQRVLDLQVGGTPVDPARAYTVCMNDFMVTAAEERALAEATQKTDLLGIVDLDALLDFVRAMPGGTIRVDAAPRIVVVTP